LTEEVGGWSPARSRTSQT